jgi:abortive infection bacteriophage resistance protein
MSQNPPAQRPPKPFRTYAELVALLQQRGMTVEDQARAERKLSQVGYYRLSGLTCRETSDHSILEGFPTVQVFSKLPTEVLGRHVVQA